MSRVKYLLLIPMAVVLMAPRPDGSQPATTVVLPPPVQPVMSQAQARRLAANRLRKIYQRVPPWLQHTAPRVHLSIPGQNPAETMGRDNIGINQQMTLDLAGANGRAAQKLGQQNFLHELVHANQRPGLPTWLSEGSAESIARKEAHHLFGSVPDPAHQTVYAPQVARVRGMNGLRRRVLNPRPAPGPLDFLK